MERKGIKIFSLKLIGRITLYVVCGIIVLLFSLLVILQIPTVQKNLIQRYIGTFNNESGYDISFENIHMRWYDRLKVSDLKIVDPNNNSLISIKELEINFEIFNLYDTETINIDGIQLQGATVNFVRLRDSHGEGDSNLNILAKFLKRRYFSNLKNNNIKVIKIGWINIEKSHFSYSKYNSGSLVNGFDFKNFVLDADQGNLNDFIVTPDSVSFQVNSLQIIDPKTNFKIEELSTYFKMSKTSMNFIGLNVRTKNSYISDSIIFNFSSPKDFSEFNEKVIFGAHLKNSIIDPIDIQKLIPSNNNILIGPIKLSGIIEGTVNQFNFSPMEISLGSSKVSGDFLINGLPKINETYFKAQFETSRIEMQDIKAFVTKKMYQFLSPLQKVNFRGIFMGLPNDFICNGSFSTSIGEIQSEINYKISTNSTYNGNLWLSDFDLGKMLGDTLIFQKVNFMGSINGSGLTLEEADFRLSGKINSIWIKNYVYHGIETNAEFKNQFFNGNLKIADPNFKLQLNGSIDLRPNMNDIVLNVKLDSALMKNINLTKKDFFVRSDIEINTHGLDLDSINGEVIFRKLFLGHADKSLELDSIHLVSTNKDGRKSFKVNSSVLDLSVDGSYILGRLITDLPKFVNDFYSKIIPQSTIDDINGEEVLSSEQLYQANFSAELHDINPILSFLDLDVEVSQNGNIQGYFIHDSISNFKVVAKIDTVKNNNRIFIDNELVFDISKMRDSLILETQFLISSKEQVINKFVKTKNFCFEGYWDKNDCNLVLDIESPNNDSFINLNTAINFLDDGIKIKLNPSDIRIIGKTWVVDKANEISLNGTELKIENLYISNSSQLVRVDVPVSNEEERKIEIGIQNFNISLLNAFSKHKFRGLLNSNIIIHKIGSDQFFESLVTVDSLKINNILYGNINLSNNLNSNRSKYGITLTLDRLGNKIITAEGQYNRLNNTDPLSGNISLTRANLRFLNPLIQNFLTIQKGIVNGEFLLKGNFNSPRFYGEGIVTDGEVMINYLNTKYRTSGSITLNSTQIQFNNFDIFDEFNNYGDFKGIISHKNFYKTSLDLYSSFTNIHLLNTVAKDNELFYGTAFGTGDVNIKGPISDISISSNLSTDKNTRFFVPINSTTDADKKDFIQFTNFTKKEITKEESLISPALELNGINFDIDLEVTPEAYTEIIFDIKSGDIIRGRGQGNLKFQIDTKGEFNMFGGVNFTEGGYNFTLYNIVNKEFLIKPGSRISWSGDPYKGNLDITASYHQNTSIAPILTNQDNANDQIIKRKYPLIVVLELEGPMLSPDIHFDIDGSELPANVVTSSGESVSLKFDFDAFKSKIDEQELKRQVFSLLVLRKLSPLYSFESVGSGTVYNSMSELFSNQLSYWLSKVDQNLEIDFDLGTFDKEAFNTLQLRLSYSFLNGRLRVSKNGYFGNQSGRSELSTIAGDWSLGYLLTPDGKFNVKMYSRSGVNQIQNTLNPNPYSITTGTSLTYTKTFNKVFELIRSSRSKRRKKLINEPLINPEDLIED